MRKMIIGGLVAVICFSGIFISCSQKEEQMEEKPDLSHLSWQNRNAEILTVANEINEITKSNNSEWKSLFNGKNLDGWIVKCRPEDKGKTFWQVDNGTIMANSPGDKEADYVWLLTKQEYGDFVLRLKFQAFNEHGGNSGIQFRSRYDDEASWLDGPQVDVAPATPWRTGMIYDETRETRRWIAPDIPKESWVDTTMANPDILFQFAEQWNELQITAIGTAVMVELNGVIVNASDMEGILDDKFHVSHNVGMAGHVALQIHKKNQVKVAFKDIFIREIHNAK